MEELPTTDPRVVVPGIVDKHVTALLEELDELHTQYLHSDDDILAALRSGGYSQEAQLYHEWLQDSVPRRYVAEDGDPEGPGGAVTDPPSDSYVRFEELLNEVRMTRGTITYNWSERERVMYSCRATVDREHFQNWLDGQPGLKTVDEADGEDLVDYLEANPGASVDERRWPAEDSEVDIFDLKVVEPNE